MDKEQRTAKSRRKTMNTNLDITAERVRHVLDYDQDTGEFRWRGRRGGTANAGADAGTLRLDGRRIITIDGKFYYAHRLAWLHVTGDWPPQEIDHIDRDPSNNCFNNLRLAMRTQNEANKLAPSHNTSGIKGVSWSKRDQKWRADIMHNKKPIFLGYFDMIEDAAASYAAAASKYHGEFAHAHNCRYQNGDNSHG